MESHETWAMDFLMSKTYRQRRLPGTIVIFFGVAIVTFGLFGISVIGLESIPFFGIAVLLGFVIGVLGGAAILSTRVIVDDRGIFRSDIYRRRFIFLWEDVESWAASRSLSADERAEDSFTFQKVEFHLRSMPNPAIVYDSDVSLPGFDRFLVDVRLAVGNLESKGT